VALTEGSNGDSNGDAARQEWRWCCGERGGSGRLGDVRSPARGSAATGSRLPTPQRLDLPPLLPYSTGFSLLLTVSGGKPRPGGARGGGWVNGQGGGTVGVL
jgi:hypothetical protein